MPRKKQLPAPIEKADVAARNRLRVRLYERFEADFEFWYQAMQSLVIFPSKEASSAAQMLRVFVERILPEERHSVRPDDDKRAGRPVVVAGMVKIYGVNRGTRVARTAAIQLKRDQRGTFTDAATAAANDS